MSDNLNGLIAALPETVTFSWINPGDDNPNTGNTTTVGGGKPSYFDLEIKGNTILNGNYDGYCIDTDRTIASSGTLTAKVFSTYETLPSDLVGSGKIEKPENLDLVNWIINQNFVGQNAGETLGTYTYQDVQRALWELTDDQQSTGGIGQEGNNWTQERVAQILTLAGANGEGFVPTFEYSTIFGEKITGKMAVILAPDSNPDDTALYDRQIIIAEVELSKIGDRVWQDTNANGIQDKGEKGIANVTVELYTCVGGQPGTQVGTTTTDANGNYHFSHLVPGEYIVKFITPKGYTLTQANVGGDDTIDSDAGEGGLTGCYTLESGENDPTVDAGLYKPASLGDRVWEDKNANGIQETGENGISGVTVELYACVDGKLGELVKTTTTNTNGIYNFSNLKPGEYIVKFITPEGYTLTQANVGGDDTIDSDAGEGGLTGCYALESGENNPTVDAGLFIPEPKIHIDKQVKDPSTGQFIDTDYNHNQLTFKVGEEITYGYYVTNKGGIALENVKVVDDNATPDDPSDDVTLTASNLISGDNGNQLLDTNETWFFKYTKTAELISKGEFAEIDKYLLIGTTSNAIAKAVNVQNGDLGADVIVLSTEINDNVDFDNDDVFLNNAGGVWKNFDDYPNTQPDYLPGAAPVGEGVSWTGDVALTSPNAKFDMSNVELYGQVGVVADSSSPVSSVSNSLFFEPGVGDGVNPADGKNLPPNGVTANADEQMAALRAELDDFEDYVTELRTEKTLTFGNGLPDFNGIEDEPIFTIDVDQYDYNGDGVAVIDIKVDNGNSDFKITNSNWIIDGDGSTFAIFRILGDSNLVLNQSTIVVGDGGIAGGVEGAPISGLGAAFIKAAEYRNASGNYIGGEGNTGDTVFSFNDTVLNGVGFYDLIVYDENIGNQYFDNGTTELKINNGQGCAQFVSPKINFNNVRFERCNRDQEQTNIAKASGTAFGTTATDLDDQTITVSKGYGFTGYEGGDHLTSPNYNVIEFVNKGAETRYGTNDPDKFVFAEFSDLHYRDNINNFESGVDLIDLSQVLRYLGAEKSDVTLHQNTYGDAIIKINGDALVKVNDVTVAEIADSILY